MFLFSQVHKTADYSQLHLQLDLLEGRSWSCFFLLLFFCCCCCCFLPMEHADISPALIWGWRMFPVFRKREGKKSACQDHQRSSSLLQVHNAWTSWRKVAKEWYHLYRYMCYCTTNYLHIDSGVPWLVISVCNLHTCTCVVYFLSKWLIKTCRRARFSKGAQIFPWSKFCGSTFLAKYVRGGSKTFKAGPNFSSSGRPYLPQN